jgi:hypothetical protein
MASGERRVSLVGSAKHLRFEDKKATYAASITNYEIQCFTERRIDMKNLPKLWPMLSALAVCLAGCAVGGTPEGGAHLSATQCSDLTALRNNAPITRERNRSQLAALEEAGYDPSSRFDPYYPNDLQAAQRQVDRWYQAECQQARPN